MTTRAKRSSNGSRATFTQTDEAEVVAMARWAANIWRSGLTVSQMHAKIRGMHQLLVESWALIAVLIDEHEGSRPSVKHKPN